MAFQPTQSGPCMQPNDVDALMAHILRLPELYTLARSALEVTLFHPHAEPHLVALWLCVQKVQEDYGLTELFASTTRAWQLVESELVNYFAGNPQAVSADYRNKLFDRESGLLHYIYEQVLPADLMPSWGRRFLIRFLEERYVQDPIRRAFQQAGSGTVLNLPLFLQQMQERQLAVTTLDVNPVKELCPVDWMPQPLGKFSTGIKFLDRFLNGGHAPGETYGILGAFGAGKTTLAVQLVVAGAAYQRKLVVDGDDQIKKGEDVPPYRPKKWYFFHYEGSRDEMRVRLLSCLCEIDKDKIEDARFKDFTTDDNLDPYEKILFRKWIEDGLDVPGERSRWEEKRTLINQCFGMVDMSGDPENPKRGQGYIPEIASIIERDLRLSATKPDCPAEVGGVVIDYAGLCCRRHVNSRARPDPDLYYRLLSDFGEDCRRQIATVYRCPVWAMHQLSGQANKRTHAFKQSHADAAGSSSFAENLYFCFALGTKDPDFGSVLLTCSKARRSDMGTPPRLEFDVPIARLRLSNLVEAEGGRLRRPGTVKASM